MKKTVQQRSPSTRNKHKSILILITVVIVICSLISIIVVTHTQTNYLQNIEKASISLHDLYEKLISDPGVDASKTSFWKRCGQSSAKYGNGTITCGPRGEFKNANTYSVAKQNTHDIDVYIRENGAFDNVSHDEFNEGEANVWSRINFVHTQTSIKCYINFSGKENTTTYSMGCNQTVPDFLPGYTVEK